MNARNEARTKRWNEGGAKMNQDITHKLVKNSGSYQILCMPATGLTRVRNVSRVHSNSHWENTTCPDCLKIVSGG